MAEQSHPALKAHKTRYYQAPASRPRRAAVEDLRGVHHLSESAVYHRTVGLFRRRTTKNRETATVDALKEQTRTAEAAVEVARREVTAEERPNPDQPGWGMTIGQQLGRGREDRPSQA